MNGDEHEYFISANPSAFGAKISLDHPLIIKVISRTPFVNVVFLSCHTLLLMEDFKGWKTIRYFSEESTKTK